MTDKNMQLKAIRKLLKRKKYVTCDRCGTKSRSSAGFISHKLYIYINRVGARKLGHLYSRVCGISGGGKKTSE
jgi:hypothetical protein